MRLLLDTHVALWAILDDPRLPQPARRLIEEPSNRVIVSAASVWEISIKHGLARADMPVSGCDALRFFRLAGYQMLSVTAEHAVAVDGLPQIHRDPFDRIIVAQALVEPLRLLTHDATLKAYSDTVLLF